MNLLNATYESATDATVAPLVSRPHDRITLPNRIFAILRFVIGGTLYVGAIFVALISLALSLLALGYASRS